MGLLWLLTDHGRCIGSGSVSVTTNNSGARTAEQLYYPWGEAGRYTYQALPTSYQYTGQRNASITVWATLNFFKARWYDSQLGRFAQAVTIIPASQVRGPSSKSLYALDYIHWRQCEISH